MNLLPLGVAGAALSWRWPRFGRLVALVALVGLYVLATPAASGLLLAGLERGLPVGPSASDPPQAIVVLSGTATYAVLHGGLNPGSGIGGLTLQRMRGGAELARRTGLPVLVTGGPLEDEAVPIAEQMAGAMKDEFGVPVRWVEPKSQDTWENAQFSAAILKRDGIGSIYLVTHAWHMRRAMMAFAHTGLKVAPAPLWIDRRPDFDVDDLLPHATAFLESYYALHEWIGCAYYALRS